MALDRHVKELILMANEAPGNPMPVVLFVSGSVIAGDLASYSEYLDWYLKLMGPPEEDEKEMLLQEEGKLPAIFIYRTRSRSMVRR